MYSARSEHGGRTRNTFSGPVLPRAALVESWKDISVVVCGQHSARSAIVSTISGGKLRPLINMDLMTRTSAMLGSKGELSALSPAALSELLSAVSSFRFGRLPHNPVLSPPLGLILLVQVEYK
jgi:hypothetical protein